MCKVQRLSSNGVHCKQMAVEAVSTSNSNDIVSSAWKHAAVRKRTCILVAEYAEDNVSFSMGPPAFQDYAYVSYDLKYTLAECKTIHSGFRDTYPEIDKALTYFIKALFSTKATFIANTVFGRTVHPRRVTDGINAMVQGSAAEVYKLAVHKLIQATEGQALYYFIFPLHDAMYLDVPEEKADYYAQVVKSCMEEAWFETIKDPYFKYSDVPMDVEVKIADRLMS